MVSTGDSAGSGGGLRQGRQREQRTAGGLAIALAETRPVPMPTCAGKQVEAHPRIRAYNRPRRRMTASRRFCVKHE